MGKTHHFRKPPYVKHTHRSHLGGIKISHVTTEASSGSDMPSLGRWGRGRGPPEIQLEVQFFGDEKKRTGWWPFPRMSRWKLGSMVSKWWMEPIYPMTDPWGDCICSLCSPTWKSKKSTIHVGKYTLVFQKSSSHMWWVSVFGSPKIP